MPLNDNQPTLPIQAPTTPTPHPTQPGHLPQWITNQLQTNSQNLTHNTARYQTCPNCHEITIGGMDHPRTGQAVRADPTPLTPQQELACLLTNRPTYNLIRKQLTPGYELQHRGQFEIKHRKHDVIPAHKCGARHPGFLEPPQPTTPNTNTNTHPF